MTALEEMVLAEPRDLWAEQSVLGCILATGKTSDDVTSDLFWDPAHLAVFQAAASMLAAGEPVTAVTVRAELMRRKHVGKVTDGAWLFTLEQAACLPAQVGYYATKLRELTARRALIHLATRAIQGASNPATDVYDLAAVMSIETSVLSDSTTTRQPVKVRNIAEFLDGPIDYDWLIEGLLEKMDRCLFTGGEGSGKSVLAGAFLAFCHCWWRRARPLARRSRCAGVSGTPHSASTEFPSTLKHVA